MSIKEKAFNYWFDYIVRNGEYDSSKKRFVLEIDKVNRCWANWDCPEEGDKMISCDTFNGQYFLGTSTWTSDFDGFLKNKLSHCLIGRRAII